MKDIRNPFRLKKEVKVIKVIVLRNIKKLFEYEKGEGNYYKPVRVNNFWRNNYIQYKSNVFKIRLLSVEEHLYKIRPYLKNIINDLKQSDTWKIQLKVRNNFISSKDDNDQEPVMHLRKINI